MKLVNLAELLCAGITCSIRAEEPSFADDGELEGYEVSTTSYREPSARAEGVAESPWFRCNAPGAKRPERHYASPPSPRPRHGYGGRTAEAYNVPLAGTGVEDFALLDDKPLPVRGEGEALSDSWIEYGEALPDGGVGKVAYRVDSWVQALTSGRWAHEADSYLSGETARLSAEAPRPMDADTGDGYGGAATAGLWRSEYERAEQARTVRFSRLLGIARKLGRERQALRSSTRRSVRAAALAWIDRVHRSDDRAYRAVAERYTFDRSAKGAAAVREWWRKPLTTAQVKHVVECLTWVVAPSRTPSAYVESTRSPYAEREAEVENLRAKGTKTPAGSWEAYLAECLLSAR